MAYPTNYRYTKEHEWIDVKGDIATIGITDYAQHELGDVVFVELPEAGAKINTGKSFGTVESVKAVSEIYAPAAGEVTETTPSFTTSPKPSIPIRTARAWLVKVNLPNPAEISSPDGRRRLRSLHRGEREGSLGLMRYLPKSPAERQEMLAAIGVKIHRRTVSNPFPKPFG